jgi:hypothetical protein
MLILAPMHPVMLVYELDQTEGQPVPSHLLRFSQFEGKWESRWLERLIENANRRRIRIDFKNLSSTHGGFATDPYSLFWFSRAPDRPPDAEKMRIVIHADLSPPSKFGILCHEMAHILLGHLGSDTDNWWPSRSHLGRNTIEIEAEATAYVVTRHLGLEGASAAYISGYLGDTAEVPKSVSFDMIAKVADKIENMALNIQAAPLTKAERAQRKSRRKS